MSWKANPILAAVIVAVVTQLSFPGLGQEGFDGQTEKQPFDEKFSLKWKVATGDVINVRHRTVTNYEREASNEQIEKILKYSWVVEEVSKNGVARARIQFDDVAFIANDPRIEFHTANEAATLNLSDGEEHVSMKYQSLSVANSEITFKMQSDGGTFEIRGADSIEEARAFTPGDLPTLPTHPVAVGESWKRPVAAGQMKGQATCKLSSVENVDGRQIGRIECTTKWEPTDYKSASHVKAMFEPAESVSHFDIEAGRFLDDESKLRSRAFVFRPNTEGEFGKSDTAEIVDLTVEQTRSLSTAGIATPVNAKSGTYILVYHDDRFQSVVLGGVSTRKSTDPHITVEEVFEVDFFHSWKDNDGDHLPSSREIENVSTRFTTEEDVRFLVTLMGMQSRKLDFELLNSHGNELLKNEIPIRRGPGAIAVREMRLPAGVYFFEFYVDDEFLVRVPVQVFAGLADGGGAKS